MSNVVTIGVVVGLGALVLLALLALVVWQAGRKAGGLPGRTRFTIADATVEPYERPSSTVSEQIEEMVRRKLQQYPDLADIVLDFATAADGTIDIWVNRRQYDNVEDIPDERIRQAIGEAVQEFNAR